MFKLLKPRKKLILILGSAGAVALVIFTFQLDFTVRDRFEGKRFKLPAKVYARALELYPEQKLSHVDLERELALLHYRGVSHTPQEPGTFRSRGNTLEIMSRPFVFSDGVQEPMWMQVEFSRNQVKTINGKSGDQSLKIEGWHYRQDEFSSK